MAKRLGYTTDLNGTKSILEHKFKNTRNWQSTEPFATKQEAAAWEAKAMAEMKCKGDGAQGKPNHQNDKWIGYVFEHDGPW